MSWPQYVYLGLTVLGLGYKLAKHGEPETDSHNFVSTAIVTAFILWILYMGGFFGGVA